jgi:glyoxylase-like metal-dependent hydrolase (beta-lactamase superfamily II)
MGTLSSKDFQKEFARAERLPVGSGWFEVVKLQHNVFALIENGHTQGVCSFLILGEQKALLFDTGMGVDDILGVVRQLTNLELVVVNSHSHFDHIGGDWLFEQVHIFDNPYAMDVLASGYAHADILYDARPELFSKALPAGFDVETYSIRPLKRERIVPICDGHVFDLGSRQLEVLHTPGHTQDGIMLFDRRNRLLFTGDTCCDFLYA